MKDEPFCYFHDRLRYHTPYTELFHQFIGEAQPGVMPRIAVYDFPRLDDAAAIQIGFMQAIHGIASGHLDPRRGRLVLSALHGAARNLKFMNETVSEAAEQYRERLKRAEAAAAAAAEAAPRKPAASAAPAASKNKAAK